MLIAFAEDIEEEWNGLNAIKENPLEFKFNKIRKILNIFISIESFIGWMEQMNAFENVYIFVTMSILLLE